VLLVFVVFFVLLPLGTFVGYHKYMDHVYAEQVREAEARADRLDPRWRLEEIEAKRAVIPDEENAALRVLEARSWLPRNWPPQEFGDAWQDHPPQALLDDDQASLLRAEMGETVGALAEARRLKDLRRGRYPLTYGENFLGTLIPHVHDARTIAALLDADARLRAQDGDIDGACDSILAMLNTGGSLGDEPLLISALGRFSIRAIAVQSLERTLALGQPSEAQLLAVQRRLEDELPETVLLHALQGERAGVHDLSSKIEAGRLGLESLKDHGSSSDPPKGWEHVSNLWAVPRIRHGHAELIDAQTDAVEVAKLPVEQQAPLFAQIDARTTGMTPYARLLLPALGKVEGASLRIEAQMRCGLTGVAVERYRRKHGRWPGRLADLKGEFLREVPLDPFDGKPLRYRKDDQGVLVYSVGKDRQDDGGDRATLNTFKDGTDIGFRLWDVDKRRQPPPPPKPPEQPEAVPGAVP
jgi:hypothetical protein